MVSLTLALYLSDEMKFGDEVSGNLYGVLGMLISVYTFPVGWLIDTVGVQRSLMCGASLCTFSRIMLATTTDPNMCVAIICTTLPLGEAFVVPSLSAAVGVLAQRAAMENSVSTEVADAVAAKSSSTAAVRKAYGIFFTMMNLGLLCCGPLVDGLRFSFPHPYRSTCLVSAACGALTLFLAQHLTTLEGEKNGPQLPLRKQHDSDLPLSSTISKQSNPEDPSLASRRRNGFMLLTVLLVGVRALFRHLDATFPKYFIRTHGSSAPFGMIYSLEPLIIVLLVPLFSSDGSSRSDWGAGFCNYHPMVARAIQSTLKPFWSIVAWVQNLSSLSSITLGCYISTAAPFMLASNSALWASPIFVCTIALGEALWAPRFYTYTHDIAPPNEAGFYFSMSHVPLFLPKLLAGVLSGKLLSTYCEASVNGCGDGWRIWMAIGFLSLPFPFLIHYGVRNGWIMEPRRAPDLVG